ncbi:hypothetical protein [Cellulomonas sp.]|uniref:hypothetical protein n=1 Tax=Cellulomonas sp. TaxID=40001 RepID=UPI002810E812|nr:hypothetical protein [Cellulomonas sp.]
MDLDPDALLAGPRGRRLCLAVARAAAELDPGHDTQPLRDALFHAGYHLDPGAGRSLVRMWSAGRVDDVELPHPSPAAVAALLDEVPLTGLDARTLLLALVHAVDHARYWQEPDGEDVLAATPPVRDALRRVAAQLVTDPETAWWSSPAPRDDQWVVDLPHASPAPPVEGDAAAWLARWRADEVADEERARGDRPSDVRAPHTGSWWSVPAFARLTTTTRALGADGPLGLWCVEDGAGWEEAHVRRVVVPTGARVLEVDGPDAWADLCRRHPLEVTAGRRHDWFRVTGRDGRWCLPDWSRVAQEADAVHVTVAGYLTTAGRAVPVDDGLATVLAGWDPDRTYWLTDVEPAATPGRRWQMGRDRGGEPLWRPATP